MSEAKGVSRNEWCAELVFFALSFVKLLPNEGKPMSEAKRVSRNEGVAEL
jgi:hypothetical protein